MPARAAIADPAPIVLWLPHPPRKGQSGRHVILYGVAAFMYFSIDLMLWFILGGSAVAGLVLDTLPTLRAPWDPFGIVVVVVASLVTTFILIISVFLLTQGVILAILSRRSISAPKEVSLSHIFTVMVGSRGGAIVTPAVHTRVSQFWTDLGDAVATIRPRVLVPAFLISLAVVLLNASPHWRHLGVNMPALYGIIIGLVVIGIPGAIWGVTRRMAQLKLKHTREATARKRRRQQWAKLTPEQRAIEEAGQEALDRWGL